jgi:hypothetical protein
MSAKHSKWVRLMRSVVMSALLLVAAGVQAADSAERKLMVQWVNLQPGDGLIVDAVVLFFHDGSFDLYEAGSAASPLLTKLATRQYAGLTPPAAGVKVVTLLNPHEGPQGDAGFLTPSSLIEVALNPQQHRFATAYIAVRPSNDAFLANDDAYRIQLFDLSGNSQLPVVLDFAGNEVMDAGVCVNNELDLQFLDVKESTAQRCESESGLVVRRHPGFNGSARNPTGTPKRILGGTSVDMGAPPVSATMMERMPTSHGAVRRLVVSFFLPRTRPSRSRAATTTRRARAKASISRPTVVRVKIEMT